jgi:DNA-binding CsgD family transcriptional regulator
MRRLARAAGATRWILGAYDGADNLTQFYVSDLELNARTALDVISSIPSPRGAEPNSVSSSSAVHDNLSLVIAAMKIDSARYLKVALIRDPLTQFAPSDPDSIGRFLTELVPHLFAEVPPLEEEPRSLSPRRMTQPAMFLLDAKFEIQFQWHAEDLASLALSHLSEPRDGRLPAFLENAVRRVTESWDLSDLATCTVGSTQPIPGLMLRVIPMRSATTVSIGVLLEPYKIRSTVRGAAATFAVSSRERDVLWLLLDGESIADIAERLHIAESTAQDHVKRLIQKTDSRNRTEMAAKILGWPVARFELTDSAR